MAEVVDQTVEDGVVWTEMAMPATPEAEPARRRHTVCVDFDGVLHSYVTAWIAPDVIPDDPVEELGEDGEPTGRTAIDWLHELVEEFEVVILTTRARPQEVEGRGVVDGCMAIMVWLRGYGYHGPDLLVTAEKVPAIMYVDDRGWRFSSRFPTAKTILRARPWRTGTPPPRRAKAAIRRARDQQRKVEEVASRRKQELAQVRTELIREILRDKDDAWFDAWWEEVQRKTWDERIKLARAEVA